MKKIVVVVALLLSLVGMPQAYAEDARYLADSAVADILFEYDGAETFATYTVNADGFVEISFARNIPDALYSEILGQLQSHENIQGVLAGTSGPACSMF